MNETPDPEGLSQAVQKPDFLTKKEIADRYQVTIGSIDKWMKLRVIPFYKIGRVVRYRAAECDLALERYRQKARR